MLIKRILIFGPLLLIIFLLQSYFWIPTYEEQTRGNPERLERFITGSIGDASLLNPVLSSDSASSQIEDLVFEGLIDRDADLSFRGRVARSWEISEQAFLCLNSLGRFEPGSPEAAQAILHRLHQARSRAEEFAGPVQRSLENIERIELEPARTGRKVLEVEGGGVDEVRVRVDSPGRIRLELARVDQGLKASLEAVLGRDYFDGFPASRFVRILSDADELTPDRRSRLIRKVLPALEHNPVLTFQLRRGVRFHDGHLLDSGDVRFTYEAIMNPKNLSPRQADFEPIKRVETPDRHAVRVIYKRLYSPALASWGMGILPEHLLNREALRREAMERGRDPEAFSLRDSRFNRRPVGCGPFRFAEWKPDQYIRLERFLSYWEGPANYKEYVYRVIPDLLTQEMEFYAGTLDSYSVQPHQVARLRKDERFQSFSGTSFGYTYIGYNLRREPFNDVRVRRALSMAIDVESIIDYVLYGQGERITGPFVKQTDYYNHGVDPLPFDPQQALELLESAGWQRNDQGWLEKDGQRLEFTLITNTGNEIRKSILAIVQNAWKRIGVDVQTDTLEWSVFIQERVNKLDFDAIVLGWVMGLEPDLYQVWHSSQTDPMELNFVGYDNPEADDLIVKIRREYDHARQVEYCRRLHEIIAGDLPYTFLYVGRWTAVLDKRIVVREKDEAGNVVYKKIEPTQTGDYTFHFNKWIKLPEAPRFATKG